MFRLVIAFVLAFGVIAPAGAYAEERAHATRAERSFHEGNNQFEDGLFEQALVSFRESYSLEPSPRVLAHIIFCLVELGRDVEAVREYDALLAYEKELMPLKSQALLESYLLDLGRVLGFGLMHVDSHENGQVHIDGTNRGKIPSQLSWRIPAGKHVVRVTIPKHAPFEREIQVKAGQMQTVKVNARKLIPIEFSVGAAVGPSLGTNLEKAATESTIATGFIVNVRQSFIHGDTFSWHVGLGYLQAHSVIDDMRWRVCTNSKTCDPRVLVTFRHTLSILGGFAHAGGRIHFKASPAIRLSIGLGIGAYVGAYTETGMGVGDGVRSASITEGTRPIFAPLLLPEIGMSTQVGAVRFGIGLGGQFAPFSTSLAAPKATVERCTNTCVDNQVSLDSGIDNRILIAMFLFTPTLQLQAQF